MAFDVSVTGATSLGTTAGTSLALHHVQRTAPCCHVAPAQTVSCLRSLKCPDPVTLAPAGQPYLAAVETCGAPSRAPRRSTSSAAVADRPASAAARPVGHRQAGAVPLVDARRRWNDCLTRCSAFHAGYICRISGETSSAQPQMSLP